MPVTPRGIVSPNDPDNWDLIVDLAAMGSSIDAAIGNSESGRSGTAAQRTSFTASAPNGFLWQDTDGIKMIWRKDGAVWVPAVWRWSGTTVQMNSFAAPDGFTWVDTSTSQEYVRVNGNWIFGRAGFTLKNSTWDSAGGIFDGGTQATIEASGATVGARNIKPTIAGTWQFVLNGSWAENNSGLRLGALAKNGINPTNVNAAGSYAGVQQAASGRTEFSLVLTTPMNGTTDTMQFSVYQNSGIRLTLTWVAMTATLLR